jgi:hypothetical protein
LIFYSNECPLLWCGNKLRGASQIIKCNLFVIICDW